MSKQANRIALCFAPALTLAHVQLKVGTRKPARRGQSLQEAIDLLQQAQGLRWLANALTAVGPN